MEEFTITGKVLYIFRFSFIQFKNKLFSTPSVDNPIVTCYTKTEHCSKHCSIFVLANQLLQLRRTINAV